MLVGARRTGVDGRRQGWNLQDMACEELFLMITAEFFIFLKCETRVNHVARPIPL